MSMSNVLNRAAWIVLLSLGAGTAHSIVSPVRVIREEAEPTVLVIPGHQPEVAPEDSSEAVEAPQDDGPLVLGNEIDLETARRAYESGLVVFVDARTVEEYEAGHIDGAIHLSPAKFEAGIPAALDFMDVSQPVIVYCVGGTCTDSDSVVFALEGLGFTSLHVFTDGYPAWEEADLPTQIGPDPFAEPFGG